ncbi:MAG: cell wall hydrolase [Alicyclobacillaceae bacterium]|jgi:N-acetylmuramoyl-L-alanine amidase|nr:cell wall hydrolase [Alicyclobacillaceae bacterium]MCY0896684.1 cell wall hydrolase [Alicyclobacillaceae bacterium]
MLKRKLSVAIASASAVLLTGVVTAQAATLSTVTVQSGQTFWTISQQYGVSLNALEAANPQVPALDILVGTQLKLPSATVNNLPVMNSMEASVSSPYDTSANLYWMAHLISAEAQGTSMSAQIAVGDVVLHRLESSGYGSNVYDVVFQQSDGYAQFSCTTNGFIYNTPVSSAYTAAEDVLAKQVDLVPGAMVFFNPAQTPSGSWVWSQPRTNEIGPFIFAK